MTETAAWDTYSKQKPERRPVNAAGETTWFNWTQYPDHGPGAEVLSITPGANVLDLGCGKGGNLAHVATLGARSVGVDMSMAQIKGAEARWPDIKLELHQAEATRFLTEGEEQFDAVFSVFGAAWFTDPAALLPAVRRRLRPGGVFAFSQRPPVEGCYGCQASYITRSEDEDPLVVKRWDYEPDRWAGLLEAHGFSAAAARVIPAPPGPRKIGTLLVRAQG
ncbi:MULTISPECIES: class I SAM-dependent methyltransferase [Streptomyces]|uniref:class I SAM-dependent methyltransferase n=1 Tax=Streptomyces TaxID=1883 RepID=UPI00206F2AB4|nr:MULTISPECIES: class I SAM-dependent methyltransferase [Streptomyces]UPT41756.1 class I SAM-dependent methyltransferase [Streptomyces sp. WAC00303]WIY75988.1 class I SAM-dependent methyltransferase [Streptomyces anulatus]